MGAVGSATSGGGLTALQVAAALQAVSRSYVDDDGDGGRDGSSAVRRTRSGIVRLYTELTDADYGGVAATEVAAEDTELPVRVVEYAPSVFSCIRRIEDVGERVFAEEWCLPAERLRMELGEGRSQALFLKSRHMSFMSKTVAKHEVDVLLKILRPYTEHIARNPSSLLMRFYMMLRVQVGDEVGFVLCFNDVFEGATSLNERWDIKGRVPKPGKFEYFPHLVRRAYEPDPYLIDTPRDRAGGGEGEERDSSVVVVEAEDKNTVKTCKDKDLTRLFWLPAATRARLVHQLEEDYALLGRVGLMDYSLLIGVTYNEGKVSRSGKPYVIRNMKMTQEAGGVERRPTMSESLKHKSLSEYVDGVHSLYDQEIYYIGIIDMLTTYTWKKRTANFCKSILWTDDTLSTIPPKAYEKRITKFTNVIFP